VLHIILSILFSIASTARAELPPELKVLTDCQSQAAIPLVFNSDRYLIKWHKDAGTLVKLATKLRERCESVRKKFPLDEGRIAPLQTEQKELLRDAKKQKAKQEELNKYIGDLRGDMEKFGGPDAKGCVYQLKKEEKGLPVFAGALEKDVAESCR